MPALPQYNLPGMPTAVGGAPPFIGPYAQNQALAQQAFESAQSQLAAQRGQTLQSYGFDANMKVDPNNPYGAIEQMYGSNQQLVDRTQMAAKDRGFSGPGYGAQMVGQAQTAAGGAENALTQHFLQAMETINNAGVTDQSKYNQATLNNRLASTRYAIDHKMFNPAHPELTKNDLNQRILKMAQQWAKAYGGSHHMRNAKGQTFQQRLNTIGAQMLWNPESHIGVAGGQF